MPLPPLLISTRWTPAASHGSCGGVGLTVEALRGYQQTGYGVRTPRWGWVVQRHGESNRITTLGVAGTVARLRFFVTRNAHDFKKFRWRIWCASCPMKAAVSWCEAGRVWLWPLLCDLPEPQPHSGCDGVGTQGLWSFNADRVDQCWSDLQRIPWSTGFHGIFCQLTIAASKWYI